MVLTPRYFAAAASMSWRVATLLSTYDSSMESKPLPLERDTVIRKGVGVVLQVMSQLWLGRILEQRLERRQHFLPVELVRSPRIVMAERHVGRFPGATANDSPTMRACM